MPSQFDVTVRIPISREHLWRIRASKTFMDFLVRNGALQRMDTTTSTAPTHQIEQQHQQQQRKQIYVPGDVVIPDIIKPIIDDSYIEITDEQTWSDSKPYVQKSLIRPSILGDVISTHAVLQLQPDDHDTQSCWHTLRGSVSVTILFLGYYVEQAVISNMKQFYENYPLHIEQFVNFVTHKYGDGTKDSMPQAIEEMLKQEQKL